MLTRFRSNVPRLAAGASLAVCLVAAPTAQAAQPVNGGRYLGEGVFGEAGPLAALQVAGDGHRFGVRGGGSFIECGREATGDTARFRLRRPRRVRIRSGGRFGFVLRRRGAALRVRGRFRTRDTIKLTERASDSRCDPGTLTLHRKFEPPFTGCRSQRAKTLLRSDTGRIFQQRMVGASDPFYFTPITYGCLDSIGRRFMLGEDGTGADGHGQDLSHFRLAGVHAGFASQICPIDLCDFGVEVVDLRDGKTERRSRSRGPNLDASYPVTDLVLEDNGSAGWISSPQVLGQGQRTDVWAYDTLGARQLDSGRGIEPKSLTLSDSTLTWRNGGATRSATLY